MGEAIEKAAFLYHDNNKFSQWEGNKEGALNNTTESINVLLIDVIKPSLSKIVQNNILKNSKLRKQGVEL